MAFRVGRLCFSEKWSKTRAEEECCSIDEQIGVKLENFNALVRVLVDVPDDGEERAGRVRVRVPVDSTGTA